MRFLSVLLTFTFTLFLVLLCVNVLGIFTFTFVLLCFNVLGTYTFTFTFLTFMFSCPGDQQGANFDKECSCLHHVWNQKEGDRTTMWVMTRTYVSRSSPGLCLCTQPKQPRAYIRHNVYVTSPIGFAVLQWDVALFGLQDIEPC